MSVRVTIMHACKERKRHVSTRRSRREKRLADSGTEGPRRRAVTAHPAVPFVNAMLPMTLDPSGMHACMHACKHASKPHARTQASASDRKRLPAFSRDRQEARIRSEQGPQERSDEEDAQLHDRILRLTEKARALFEKIMHAGIPHALQ